MKSGLKDNRMPVLREPDPRLDDLARKTIGAAIEVHRELGPGFPETVYSNPMAIELRKREIPFDPEHSVVVKYRNAIVGEGFVDFLIDGDLIVELKSVEELAVIHSAQIISYMKAKDKKLGLLINFNTRMLKDGVKRVVRS